MTTTQPRSQVRNLLIHLSALFLLLFAAVLLPAQNTTAGALIGTITDPTGAAIPGAAVKVTNQGTGAIANGVSTSKGSYDVENLPGGDYTLTTTLAGFSELTIKDIHLDPGQRRGQDVKLAIGNIDTKVDVQADTLAVQTESAESGGTISAKEVANLMLNGRNFQQLATLVPGVSSIKGANSQVDEGYLGQTNLIVGGSSVEQTTYTIDGVYNMTPSALINVNITPSIDVINEMRVLKNAYSAKYGYAGSGQILIDTKSGTREFHGTGYEYIRNNSFAVARPYSISGIPVTSSSLHLNIYGFTFGGPIQIPKVYHSDRFKTFFFTGAEFKTNHYASLLNSRSELTATQRLGDLSQSYPGTVCTGSGANAAASAAAGCTAATNNVTRFLTCDSYCSSLLAARNLTPATCFTKDASGVTNHINPACFDPASAYFINPANNFLPLPNVPGNNYSSFANYVNTNPELDNQNDTFYRIDQHIGDKHLVTLRYMHEEVNDIRPARNYNDPAPNPGATVYTPAANMLARWNYNVTPTIINTASLAYTYQKVVLNPTGNYFIPNGLIKQAFSNGDNRLPGIGIGGYYSWLGVGAQPNYSKSGDGIVSDDVSYVKGRHVISGGGFYMWNIIRLNASSFGQGNFSFGSTHTGDVAGDFLLGTLSSYSQASIQRSGVFHQHWFEFYAQDDWKATPRLTLNYGLRYSFYSPTTKEGNDISNFVASAFDPSMAPVVTPYGAFSNPAAPVTASGSPANLATNGIVSACNGIPCGITTPKKGLVSPRLGFAYRINDRGTLSLHGGYGVGYTQVGMFQTSGLLSNAPFVTTANYSNTQFSNPAAGNANAPSFASATPLDSTYRPAMIQSWSLTLENEIVPHGVLAIAYAGNKTDHIFSSNVDDNYPVFKATTYTANCAANSANPATTGSIVPNHSYDFDPCLNSGNNTVATGPGYNVNAKQTNANYYRPYQGYGGLSAGHSEGLANYNALQTGFVYRLHALQLNLAYTWSKSLGDQNPTGAGTGYDSATGFTQPYNPKADYGLPNYDRTHVFTGAYVYELPFFAHSNHLLARELLSHWGTSGLATLESGFAATVGLSSSTSGLTSRPNQFAPVPKMSHTSGKKALGQAPLYGYNVFQLPAFGYFGNAHVGNIRGPREINFATAVNKTFPITERIGVQLRAEAFNVFNHPNITSVGSTFSNSAATNASSFGYATGAGDMRQMEFSGRINF